LLGNFIERRGNNRCFQDLRNTVGNIAMNWYNEYPHIGYDLEGKKILKPKRGDEIDNFLRKVENPESWYEIPQISPSNIFCLISFLPTGELFMIHKLVRMLF
jgi:BOP1NT (NUC169) domain